MKSVKLHSQAGSMYKALTMVITILFLTASNLLVAMASGERAAFLSHPDYQETTPVICNAETAVAPQCDRCQVTLYPPDHSGVGRPGTSVAFLYSITNQGDRAGMITVTTDTSQGWIVTTTPSEPYWSPPGHIQEIAISALVPSDAMSGTVNLTTITATLECDAGQTSSDSAIMTTRVERPTYTLFLPIIEKDLCPNEMLINGDFENPANHLLGWQEEEAGGLPVSVVCDPTFECDGGHTRPSCVALLGSPDFPAEDGYVPEGRAVITQTVRIPDTLSPTLTFDYDFCSYDAMKYDWLEVRVNNVVPNNGTVGNTTGNYPRYIRETGKEIDLSDYRDMCITLSFSVLNTGLPQYNTWAYIDNVRLNP